jgi:glutathione S-transferase
MMELYHNINSVCAQKVRIALNEKGQEAKDHILTLRGDQNDPAYLKLNPSGVVPTLIHDGRPIVESSLILCYIDDVFPDPPLMPKEPRLRHRVRMYNKLIDEYMHNACTIMTFATAFRPNFLKMPREAWLAEINKAPLKRRAEYKRSVIEHGLDSEFVIDALAQHRKLLSWMADSLKEGRYLAGNSFSNADAAVIPYILRLELLRLGSMWAQLPAIADWWALMRERPSVKAAIFDRMTETDWVPFKNLAPEPCQGAGAVESRSVMSVELSAIVSAVPQTMATATLVVATLRQSRLKPLPRTKAPKSARSGRAYCRALSSDQEYSGCVPRRSGARWRAYGTSRRRLASYSSTWSRHCASSKRPR